MSTEVPTKLRIIEAAEPLMLEKGFHSVGLNEILKAVGVPKGSFYHHFESKERFGAELLEHYVACSMQEKHKLLLGDDIPLVRDRFQSLFDQNIQLFEEKECKCPCLIVKLAAEVSNFSDEMRDVLANAVRQWHQMCKEAMKLGMQQGQFASHLDPETLAPLFGALWYGATQQAIILKESAPLKRAKQHLLSLLIPQF